MASNGDIELKPNGEVQNTFNYNAARNLKLYGDADATLTKDSQVLYSNPLLTYI